MQRRTLTDEVYDWLIDQIVIGELRPGDQVVEARVARELDISTTPVRAALEAMVTEGVLRRRVHHGCTVTDPTLEEHADIIELRESVEALAARLMASQGTEENIARLTVACEAVNEAIADGDIEQYALKDFEFHRQIIRGCGNDYVVRVANAETLLLLSLFEDEPLRAEVLERGMSPADDHRRILRAIQQQDPESAERCMREHVRSKLSSVRSVVGA
jgi:DNA-binding GntR family transcriptional regulator